MLADIIDVLVCPHCQAAFSLAEKNVRCQNGHSFDVARQGYVNLLTGPTPVAAGDSAEMVEARARFLDAGHYAPISSAVARAVLRQAPSLGPVADVGAGTGHHLAAALDASGRTGVALDISKAAARRAARAHPHIGAVVCDAWGPLPVRDGSLACVLDIFSPRNPAEFHRVLSENGIVVVVTPRADHLAELVTRFGLLGMEQDKAARLEAKMSPLFRPTGATAVSASMNLSPEEVVAVVRMGPSARHLTAERIDEELHRLPSQSQVTLSVSVSSFVRVPGSGE